MNRLNKILLSFVLPVFCLLINVSYAIPENYYWSNFLVGSSFWHQAYADGKPSYYPNPDSEDNYANGVVSYNNTRMLGDSYETALKVLNLDNTTGKKITLEPNEMLVVNSFSGQADSLYIQGSLNTLLLGSSTPYYFNTSYQVTPRKIYASTKSHTTATSSNFTTQYSSSDTSFLGGTIVVQYTNVVDSSLSLKTMVSNTSIGNSNIYLLANCSSSNAYISLDSVTIDLTDLPEYECEKNLITDTINYSLHGFSSSLNSTKTTYVFLPNLDANIDVYFEANGKLGGTISSYKVVGLTNIIGYMSFNSSNSLGISVETNNMMVSRTSVSVDFVSDKYSDYAPIFLNNLVGQYKYAIQVNGGYISIDNYDELIEKLKEAGFGSSSGGSSDLTRVIELLEDINTGGETGEEVKELIGILEEYHQQLQNQANFGSATGIFDTYKNILEFSSDMHWLITANNALFEYFAGFIMMCAMFLFLSRVMR